MITRRLIATAVAAPLLVFALVGCAPEPTDGVPDSIAGAPEKGAETQEGSGWAEATDPNDPSLRSVELPADFPSDAFALPANAVIYDASSARGGWFVVLRAADAAQAEVWWAEVPAANGLIVSDESTNESDGSRSATLTGPTISAIAVLVPDTSDGSVLLSYDLTPQAL